MGGFSMKARDEKGRSFFAAMPYRQGIPGLAAASGRLCFPFSLRRLSAEKALGSGTGRILLRVRYGGLGRRGRIPLKLAAELGPGLARGPYR